MKKLILQLAVTLCAVNGALSVQAQNPAPTPDREFNENVSRAQQYEARQPGVALEYYKRALGVAKTDVQKATAHLGIGKATPLHGKGEADPKNENAARTIAFETVLALAEASAVQKHEARLALGGMELILGRYEAALARAEAVSQDLNGSQPAQRGEATLRAGEALVGLQRHDEARKRLNDFLAVNAANSIILSPARKTAARNLIARSYLAQNNPRLALAELNKRIAANTPDLEAAQIYLDNGAFLRKENQPALARASYEMIPALAEATAEANLVALLHIGSTYFEEKNYAKAREIWNFVPLSRGGEKLASNAWRSIGIAYVQEKNYVAAREALVKSGEAAGSDVRGQIEAWETIASTFLDEKNYAAARETLAKVGKIGANLPNIADRAQIKLREKFGVAQVYRAEGNFAQAAIVYGEVLDLVPITVSDPSYYYDARKQVKAAADDMAKGPNSMNAAYTLYERWEKFYPYEFNKGEANMAMGDILVAQGKKDEAKAKYQRVIELRKNYDDAKVAQSKIDKLDGKIP